MKVDELTKNLPEDVISELSGWMLAQSKKELYERVNEMVSHIEKMQAPYMGDDAAKEIVGICGKIIQRFLVISCVMKNDLSLLGQLYDAMKHDAIKGFHRLYEAQDNEESFEQIMREAGINEKA